MCCSLPRQTFVKTALFPHFKRKPWINNQAKRVSRTRWRGSSVWEHRGRRVNRVTLNLLSLLLQLTSSRCEEETGPYTHIPPPIFSPIVFCILIVVLFFFSGAPPGLWSKQPGSYVEPCLWACQNKEVWRRESKAIIFRIQWCTWSFVFVKIFLCPCSSACSGGRMEICGGHAVSRAAARGQTCCPAAAKGHYTGTGM